MSKEKVNIFKLENNTPEEFGEQFDFKIPETPETDSERQKEIAETIKKQYVPEWMKKLSPEEFEAEVQSQRESDEADLNSAYRR